MHRIAFVHVLAIVSLSPLALSEPPRIADDGSPPRFVFKVGEVLIYHSKSEFSYQAGKDVEEGTWKVHVLRMNEDQSARLLFQIRKEVTYGGAASPQQQNLLAYCDVFTDGRIVENDSQQDQFSPRALFPALPADLAQARMGWTSRFEFTGTLHHYSVHQLDPAGQTWTIDDDPEMAFRKVYGMETPHQFTIAGTSGRVTSVTTRLSQNWGFVGSGESSLELLRVERLDDDVRVQLANDLVNYQKILKEHRQSMEKAWHEGLAVGARRRLEAAVRAFEAKRDSFKSTEILDQFDREVVTSRSSVDYMSKYALDRAAVLGFPSPDWELEDLEGKVYSMNNLRGKIVVLDFWYRGCGWCLRAMPQLNALAEEFKDPSVVILGMNDDKDLADAKFVADAMQLRYPTLKADGIAARYKVRGFPTIILIDADGIVREVYAGYSHDLRRTISGKIRSLLSIKEPGKSSIGH